MTDNTEQMDSDVDIAAQMPTMNSYEVTVVRKFEMDLAQKQAAGLVEQSGANYVEEALENLLMQQETEYIDAEQKLLGVDVQVESEE